MAAKLQTTLGYSSLSTLVEDLVRDEYERRNGPMKLGEDAAPNTPSPPAVESASEGVSKTADYVGEKLTGQGNSHQRRKAVAAKKKGTVTSSQKVDAALEFLVADTVAKIRQNRKP